MLIERLQLPTYRPLTNPQPDENLSHYVIVTVVFDSIQAAIRSLALIDSQKSASVIRNFAKDQAAQTSQKVSNLWRKKRMMMD